ncbi:MAG: AbrB/MazE/SpoVT family DNA-binding domain-containing protein [Clostridia bacterium]|nr:AbrB/MazE/SpoVT family DNA-binding domain-containing protein [Clostridia bacterium]
MKATGIVRRIDDLGRVVIPKEIRRTLRIREGDPLEIFTASDGEVIFKKYSPMGELLQFSGQYSEVLSRTSGMPVLITDRDHVISASGIPKKDVLEKHLSKDAEELMENRESYVKKSNSDVFYPVDNSDLEAALVFPIIASGDIGGGVIFLSDENKSIPSETEIKLAQVAAAFLGKQMEE